MSRPLGYLPYHNPVQEFDRIILIDGAVAHHPVILIDGESIHFARGRERQRYGLSDRGHEARSWVRATCPGGGCGTPISRIRRPTASECSTIPQRDSNRSARPYPCLVPPTPRLFSRRITVQSAVRPTSRGVEPPIRGWKKIWAKVMSTPECRIRPPRRSAGGARDRPSTGAARPSVRPSLIPARS